MASSAESGYAWAICGTGVADLHAMIAILAQSFGPTTYFNFVRMGAVTVFFLLWCALCQWVDRDTDTVKTKREQWNLIVLSGGIAGLAVVLLVPWAGNTFFLGVGFWLLLAGGSALFYVMHRNGRVVPDARVLTWGHAKRAAARLKGEQKPKEDKGQRVQLADFDGKKVSMPDNYQERLCYDAAQEFLFDMLWRRASDVDLVFGGENARVRYKIDGVVAEQNQHALNGEDAERLLSYFKKLAGLNPDERRRPQSGKIRTALLGQPDLGDVEVRTSGSTRGEHLRLRVRLGGDLKRLDEIGLAAPREELLKQLVAEQAGVVLFSGPSESGVTTTLYAVLRDHDAFMQNIYTLERRPLFELDNITQNTYKGEAEEGVSYARALQTVLRREPDIVMVGECTDRETAQIACGAGDEKKLYVAFTAKSTIDALGRFLALVEDNKLAAGVLLGAVNQRLMRILCPACRVSYRPDAAKLKKLNLPADKIEHFHSPPTDPVLDKKGREIICQTCQGSGYVGRTGVFEVMRIDENIRAMIADSAPLKLIKQQSRKSRMYYLMEEALLKVIDGTTSMDEVLRGLREDNSK